jgi:hypothetical protein
MSNTSILGSTPTYPINPAFINSTSSNYAGGFTSNEMPPTGYRGIYNNAEAASASKISGGGRRNKISHKYRRMSSTHRKFKRGKKSKKCGCSKWWGGKKGGKSRRRRVYKGGAPYAQFSVVGTPSYSLGGTLSAGNSMLASPPPVSVNTKCFDNYNHYAGSNA